MALCTMTRTTVRMLEKHRQTRWATEDQQLQTVRESEKTGRKKKRGKRKGERKRLKGIYKKKVEVKELTKQKSKRKGRRRSTEIKRGRNE